MISSVEMQDRLYILKVSSYQKLQIKHIQSTLILLLVIFRPFDIFDYGIF